jgi:hypothetical protein
VRFRRYYVVLSEADVYVFGLSVTLNASEMECTRVQRTGSLLIRPNSGLPIPRPTVDHRGLNPRQQVALPVHWTRELTTVTYLDPCAERALLAHPQSASIP